jgi:uncharacterized protein YggE
MTQTIKNILGAAAALAVLALGYAALSYVNAYSKVIEPSSFRSFSVFGEGKTTAIPDIATFSFQVISEGGKDVAALQAKNTTAINKIIAGIKAQSVADKDIKTEYYNVDPRYETYNCITPLTYGTESSVVKPCPPAAIVGYTVTQSVNVKMRDFTKIGDIMGGVVTNGANQVGSLSFTIDDPSQVYDQARAQAITRAQAKAESIATAGKFKIGRLLGIQEGSPVPVYNYSRLETLDLKAGGAPAATPTIQPGSQEISVTVTMQYEIK